MGQLWEYVKMALANIRMNRGRSFLTMLGIIIGVSSVILIMSVGNGARMEMEQELWQADKSISMSTVIWKKCR